MSIATWVELECGHKRHVFNPRSKIRKQEAVYCADCKENKVVVKEVNQ